MAAPNSASLENMQGRWTFHKGLSDSTDALLTLQGQPWWKRQAASVVTVTEHIRGSRTSGGVLRYDIDLRISGGFKGGAEWLLMDGSEDIMEHANLGRITNICSWSDLSEFDKDDAWLTEGWLKGPNSKDQKHVKTDTTSERGGWRLTNIWGFVEINGARFHARKLLIRRGDDVAKCRAIYAWAGE